MTCTNCGEGPIKCQEDHPGLCCDCFDLSVGMSLDDINVERAAKGKPPLPCRHLKWENNDNPTAGSSCTMCGLWKEYGAP